MKTLRFDLPLLVPHSEGDNDPRLDRLLDQVTWSIGVRQCGIVDDGAGPLLIVRYDPLVADEERVEQAVREAARPP